MTVSSKARKLLEHNQDPEQQPTEIQIKKLIAPQNFIQFTAFKRTMQIIPFAAHLFAVGTDDSLTHSVLPKKPSR